MTAITFRLIPNRPSIEHKDEVRRSSVKGVTQWAARKAYGTKPAKCGLVLMNSVRFHLTRLKPHDVIRSRSESGSDFFRGLLPV